MGDRVLRLEAELVRRNLVEAVGRVRGLPGAIEVCGLSINGCEQATRVRRAQDPRGMSRNSAFSYNVGKVADRNVRVERASKCLGGSAAIGCNCSPT